MGQTNGTIYKTSSGYFDGGYDSDGNKILIEIVDKQARESGGGGSSSIIKFTEDNLEWLTETEETDAGEITYIQTCGEEAEDTLVWFKGAVTLDLGTHTTIAGIKAGATLIDIDEYEPGSQDAEEVFFDFDSPQEATAGQWKQMRWRIQNTDESRIFYIELLDESGEVVTYSALDVTNKITHYYAMLVEIPSLSVNNINEAYIYDPIYPLPHDSRLATAFDKRGYVTIGNKQVQLIDITKEDIKDIDWNDIYYFFDGTNTYIYDFYRKDFSMVHYTNRETVNIELEMNGDGHDPVRYDLGVYKQDDTYGMISNLLYFQETDEQRAYYLQFKAVWDDDDEVFKCKWYVKDYDRKVIAETETAHETLGPVGIYLAIPGAITLKDFLYGADIATGQYSRFNPESATIESTKADWWRDSKTIIADDRKSFDTTIQYAANYGDNMPAKNYYITNGQIIVQPNGSLPLGRWKLVWYDLNDNIVESYQWTEESEDDRLQTIQYVREARGAKTLITHNSQTNLIIYRDTTREEWLACRISWASDSAMGEGIDTPLYDFDTNAIMERIYATNIATTDEFGSVKFDGTTITMNSQGQLTLGLDVITDDSEY